MFRVVPVNLLLLLTFLDISADAQEVQPAQPEQPVPQASSVVGNSLTLFEGQGVDHNLPGVPKAIVTGDFRWQKAYYTGLAYARTRGTLGGSFESLQGTLLGSLRHGYEIIYLQHRGLETNGELGATYFLRTPDLELGPVHVNFGAGGGLSRALGTPTYEDTPVNHPNRHYRTQFSGFLELEWSVAGLPQASLAMRVQHRSGMYGLIAPRRVGSNFLGIGLRYRF